MKHKIGFNRLGRNASHRLSLHRNMVTSLVLHERIRTTVAKAKAVRRTAEKMVTRAGTDSVHNRRIVGKDIKDKAALAKLFTEIGPRFKARPGGYTRILRLGARISDGAEMVLLEFVADDEGAEGRSTKKKKAAGKPDKKKDGPKKTESKKDQPSKKKSGDADNAEAATVEPAASTEAPSDSSSGSEAENATSDATNPGDAESEAGDAKGKG